MSNLLKKNKLKKPGKSAILQLFPSNRNLVTMEYTRLSRNGKKCAGKDNIFSTSD